MDQADRSVDIGSLRTPANVAGRLFYCVACGERMVARLGTEVAHHFAHRPNSSCCGETYLHKLAKLVFKEEYAKCLGGHCPFTIEIQQRTVCAGHPGISERACRTKLRPHRYDLSRLFPKLKIEAGEGNFVPDITLESRSSGQRVFVEIAVTHPCSDEKKRSGNRIIELRIKREDDLQPIRDHLFAAQDDRVSFHNFKQDIADPNMCSWFSYCRLTKRVFRVFRTGAWDIRYAEKHQQLSKKLEAEVVWSKESLVDRQFERAGGEFDTCPNEDAADAFAAGCGIRECRFCDNFDYWSTHDCRKLNKRVAPSQAVTCEHFCRADQDLLMSILADY